MNEATQHSRRQLLQWFASVPFLPLGAMASASALTGCGSSNSSDAPLAINLKSATFTSISLPAATDTDGLASVNAGSTLSLTWADDSKTDYKLGYKTFFKTGQQVPDGKGGTIIAGGYYDINNKPVIDTTYNVNGATGRQFFSDCPDGTSLLTVPGAQVDGVKGNPVFAVVQFEYMDRNWAGKDADTTTDPNWFNSPNNMYGKLSSPIAVLTLDQSPSTGALSLVKYHNVDTSSVNGLWITCGASLSPWGTHLSSEEYEPDAWNQGVLGQGTAVLEAFSQNVYGDKTKANAYNYGHLPEVTVNTDGTGSIKKHYCMGRISHELVQVMPDNRTALMGDDSTNGGLFMFVADKEKDLSAGTLYVAKYTSVLSETTTGNIQWIKLGSATSKEIRDLVDGGIKKEAILDSVLAKTVSSTVTQADVDAQTADLTAKGYTRIILNKKGLWVKILDEKAAAFLETHRYAAMKGGSLAFTKLEGTTVNIKDKKAYSACQNIQDSMVEGGAGWSASTNIKFANNKTNKPVGGVLEHQLSAGQVDSTGATINSEWVPTSTKLLLQGEIVSGDPLGNPANPDKLANPDNLKFSEAMRTLFIGEDSTSHVKDCLWAYNVDQPVNWGVNPVRILATPAGAESTGLHAVDNINGWTYIMSNFQHPGDWEPVHATIRQGGALDKAINDKWDNRFSAAVGYLTADPIAPSANKK